MQHDDRDVWPLPASKQRNEAHVMAGGRMSGKYHHYVVFLKDSGTNKVTRHRVKAPDRELAMRSFSDRGLHTLGAVDLRIHLMRRLGAILALLLVLYGVIWFAMYIIGEIRFYFF